MAANHTSDKDLVSGKYKQLLSLKTKGKQCNLFGQTEERFSQEHIQTHPDMNGKDANPLSQQGNTN